MGDLKRALGLMSGTSMDGIDVALIKTDGEAIVERGPSMTVSYDAGMRRLLVSAIADAKTLTQRDVRPGCLSQAERALTEQHAAAVSAFLRKQGIKPGSIDVIGFHGQTVLHRAPALGSTTLLNGETVVSMKRGLTLQLGLGQMLADMTHSPVVYDLRGADMASGGQGAPLVPVYHRALAANLPQRPLAIVNVGGVANVTWIGRDGRLIAFDTGPGNALIDDWMMKTAGIAFDEDGRTAATGKVHEDVVHFYVNHSYFAVSPPKSLDRNAFFWDLVEGLSFEDGTATLTAFTAASIAKAREHLPEEPELWVVCGGGRRNRTLMSMIAGRVEHAVVPAEAAGLDGDSIEAEAWAYLAVRSLKGLPITFPGTTGVAAPMTGGILAKPKPHLVH